MAQRLVSWVQIAVVQFAEQVSDSVGRVFFCGLLKPYMQCIGQLRLEGKPSIAREEIYFSELGPAFRLIVDPQSMGSSGPRPISVKNRQDIGDESGRIPFGTIGEGVKPVAREAVRFLCARNCRRVIQLRRAG